MAIVVYDKIKWPTAEPVGGRGSCNVPLNFTSRHQRLQCDFNLCDILASWLEIKLSAAGATSGSPDDPKKLDFEGEEYFDVSTLS